MLCNFPHFPVKRDMSRGRELNQILNQYTKFVKPAFEDFCLPVSLAENSGGHLEVFNVFND